MTHGCIPPLAEPRHRPTPPVWQTAAGRGAVIGVVAVLHLLLLALVWRAPPPRNVLSGTADHEAPLRIRLIAAPPVPVDRSAPATHVAAAPVAPRHQSATVTPPVVTAAQPDAEPFPVTAASPPTGDYHSPLGNVPRFAERPGGKVALPGSDVLRAPGVRLGEKRSLQQKVRALTLNTRCGSTRLKMARSSQFISKQQMDRLLEADGCGAHQEPTAADATIEAMTEQAIFGD